ncbi:MAG: hypothetical protein KGN16_12195 [Burkholderiales bacterium]|nr:hypothetical protein [Burkholderiales bacterium]
MPTPSRALALLLALAWLGGCSTRSANVQPLPASAAEFAAWDCDHIEDEIDIVQQRAADVAYAVDERSGNNIVALGVGLTLFWPAVLAMRPNGLEAAELARLKGRDEALRTALREQRCPARDETLPAARAAALPVAIGERLVYENRTEARGPAGEWALRVTALRRGDMEYRVEGPGGGAWKQDLAGNIVAAPAGQLQWPHLLRHELDLGGVTAGDIVVAQDPLQRARMRGQVVAVGPQTIAGRRFDVAVIELFGDAPRGDASTRVEGVIVVDRHSGILLRLDLRSAQAPFNLQRRLTRIEAASR